MWEEDEDNNPYGSFQRRDSNISDNLASSPGQYGFHNTRSPPSGLSSPNIDSPEFISHPHDLSDVDYDDEEQSGSRVEPKKGGYGSRVEQILYENPDLEILITYAGKNTESGGSFIAYTIQTGGLEVRRRYSEFASLRQTLVNLHPTLIIPPIPEKHSMADYAAKPTKAKEDAGIIELRKRMLAVFLNRCKRMKEVREDGVFWRFLDSNASWTEVLASHPAASIPKQVLRAPPLDPANPKPGHQWLPVPSPSAKLRNASSASGSGMPIQPPGSAALPSMAAHTTPGPALARFPPTTQDLSEEDLDPYFVNFESSSKDLENLLQGSMERSNQRMLKHYATIAEDLAELGAKYNGFSLSEQSPSLAAAIEKTGQAVDNTYIKTTDLASQLSATFSEPMRESAQFAGVVRSVLRYRVLKRVQEQMTEEDLRKKKELLISLKEQEDQSQRMANTLSGYSGPQRSKSVNSRSSTERPRTGQSETSTRDDASIDSDFPPTTGYNQSSQSYPDVSSSPNSPSQNQGQHKKTGSQNFISKTFGKLSHTFHGVVDSDPVKTRHDLIGRTRESVGHLEEALVVSREDVRDASKGVLADLKRFQGEKEEDLRRYMIAFAQCHVEWAKKNLSEWEGAKAEVGNIEVRDSRE